MTAKPDLDQPTVPECRCAECGATFPLPAVALCPECGSRQVRRLPILEVERAQRRSTLAAVVNVLASRAAP